jgi:F-type H+-transporting ATPase subunit b
MLIDWFTVGAQALNFLILVYLMKRFLYKPILRAIDEREKKVAAELAGASASKADAEKGRDDFACKQKEFEEQRTTLMTRATEDAKAERGRLLDEARSAADALTEKRRVSLAAEADHLNGQISGRARQEVFAIARKALTDLASASLEQSMVDVFDRRLRGMDAETKNRLDTAIKTSRDPALICTVFPLAQEQRDALQKTVNETFSAAVPLRFDTAPDLVGGIELSVGGQQLAWTISHYLLSVEKGVTDLLNRSVQPTPVKDAGPEPRPSTKAA